MARYRATFDTSRDREDVFAYLSDFSTTEEWDPGIVEAARLTGSPIGEGTEFRLVADFLTTCSFSRSGASSSHSPMGGCHD